MKHTAAKTSSDAPTNVSSSVRTIWSSPGKGSGANLAVFKCSIQNKQNNFPTIKGLVQSLHLPIAGLSRQSGVTVSFL
jgi:hypothetical protein